MQNMEKPLMSVFYFFHNIGPNLAQILPHHQTHFIFFCWFPMIYVKGFK